MIREASHKNAGEVWFGIFAYLLLPTFLSCNLQAKELQKQTSGTLRPVTALCGIMKRQTVPLNEWVGAPNDCSEEIKRRDSLSYKIVGTDIRADQIPVIKIVFDLKDFPPEKIKNSTVMIEMTCKSALSIYNLTDLGDWKPALGSPYFKCETFSKEKRVAKIRPTFINKMAQVLIAPGTGDSEGYIDYIYLTSRPHNDPTHRKNVP